MLLQKGANIFIPDTVNDIQIQLEWGSGRNVVPYCLLLDEEERIAEIVEGSASHAMVLYHEKQTIRYKLSFAQLAQMTKKIVFICWMKEGDTSSIVRMTVTNEAGFRASCELYPSLTTGVLVLGEMYHYRDNWKVRANCQEIKGSMNDFRKVYTQGDKQQDNLFNSFPKVAAAIDVSVHSDKYVETGQLQQLFQAVYMAFTTINLTKEMSVWLYAADHMKVTKVSTHNFKTYINQMYPKNKLFGGLGLENQEIPVVLEMLTEYKEQQAIVAIISNGSLHDDEKLIAVLRQGPKHILWILFVHDEHPPSKSYDNHIKRVNISSMLGLQIGEIQQTILQTVQKWKKSIQ